VLIASVEPAELQLASVNEALEGLDTLCGDITNQRQALETKITARIRLIHEALEARQKELIAQLDQLTQQKLKNLTAQKDQLELVATRLKSCCGFLQESLRTGSQVEILEMVKPFVQQVKDVTSTFKPESLAPEEDADLEFISSETELTRTCQQYGQITAYHVCHTKCHAEGPGLAMMKPFVQQVQDVMSKSLAPEEDADLEFISSETELTRTCQLLGQLAACHVCHAKCHAEGPGLHVAMVSKAATATVYVVDREGREYHCPVEVSCELVSSDGSSQVRGEAKRVRDSQYEISYHPQHRGQHYLHIRVEDKHISGSPFPLSVLTTTPSNIISSVKHPWGLALNNRGHLLVVENGGHCLSIFSDNGRDKRSFGSSGSVPDQRYHPCGVALSATGDILVCDQLNHRIHIFSPNGNSVKCVGTKGSGHLQFSYPVGIAVHPHSNKIYIADAANHRIQILNANLTYCSIFGSKGSENGQFQKPRDISFDSIGNVHVADTENHRIQVFTADGDYLRQFGKKGKSQGELDQPKGIAINCNDIVYVSEQGNDRISLFTREGDFLISFGTYGTGPGQFNGPTGIMISNNGVIYVSDRNSGRVQVF
jgi:tripartite motif-containing protein 2/3/tripartite motif-containing protein 71